MKTLADGVRSAAMMLATMDIEADIISNVKSTWDAIRETDMGKKIEVFVQRAGGAIKRWLDSRLPGVAQAVSKGTDGALILTPDGELVSKDRKFRFKI
jgi:hypothetical protein